MLMSQSDQWRKERTWILHFLANGLVGRLEWAVLRRRHTWDLLASQLTSGGRDITFRHSVLEVRIVLSLVVCLIIVP